MIFGLRSVEATKRVVVSGAENVSILYSRFQRELRIQMGEGDSTLTVKRSVISDLDADGGLGTNMFDDQGGNSIMKRKLSRFI